jgi:uncharacterized protein (DUF58 family)
VRRIVLVSLLAYSLFAFGLLIRNGKVIALAIPFIVFLSAAILFAPDKPQLKISRSFSEDYISPGKIITVKVSVFNKGGKIEELFIEDHPPAELELVEGKTKTVVDLPNQASFELEYKVRGKRGSYLFGNVDVNLSDSLGLINRKFSHPAPGKVFIKPEVWKLRSVNIRPLKTHLYTGPIPARRGGAGMNFFEVREYAMGDPLRRINWKVAARHEENLFTNQFELERIADIGLILDARQQTDVVIRNEARGEENSNLNSLFDYSIQASAALADLFLREGHRVGLLIYGRGLQATFPGYGKMQRERILRSLAQARTGDNVALENLNYLPVRFFPAKSQLVFISPLSPADPPIITRLLAHSYQVMIVSPNPVSFEAMNLPSDSNTELAYRLARLERTLLFRRLQETGITLIDWQVHQPLEKVLGAVLLRAPSGYRRLGIGF